MVHVRMVAMRAVNMRKSWSKNTWPILLYTFDASSPMFR